MEKKTGTKQTLYRFVFIIIFLSFLLPSIAFATQHWYNPFSWSPTTSWYNPFSWSNYPTTIYNPFTWFNGANVNVSVGSNLPAFSNSSATWYNPFSWFAPSGSGLPNDFGSHGNTVWYNPLTWLNSSTPAPNSGGSISGSGYTGLSSCNLGNMRTFRGVVMGFLIGCIFSNLIKLILAMAVVVFLWGIFKFMTAEGDDKQAGRQLMFWSIVGIFVMVSVWGLVNVLQSTFTLNNNVINPRQITIPSF
jgi:hypothetical protein